MKPEKIYSLSGDDPALVAACDGPTRRRFLAISLLLLVIGALLLLSSWYTFLHVFDSVMICFVLALFFSWMMMNIYRLLLYTLSKNTLPHVPDLFGLACAHGARLVFVCFLAFLVSAPLECFFYSEPLDRDIKEYKADLARANSEKIRLYYQAQVQDVKSFSNNPDSVRQFAARMELSRQTETKALYRRIASSDFFLCRIRFVCTKHLSCWLLTALFMLIFLTPLYLKRKVTSSSYYQMSGGRDRRKIELAYYAFKKKYTALFIQRHARNERYSEPYADAPYNTSRRHDGRRFYTQENLLSELYDAGT